MKIPVGIGPSIDISIAGEDTLSDGLNYVQSLMFDRLKPKKGFWSSITNKRNV